METNIDYEAIEKRHQLDTVILHIRQAEKEYDQQLAEAAETKEPVSIIHYRNVVLAGGGLKADLFGNLSKSPKMDLKALESYTGSKVEAEAFLVERDRHLARLSVDTKEVGVK